MLLKLVLVKHRRGQDQTQARWLDAITQSGLRVSQLKISSATAI
jgi:hypothetical protein